ncbi:hypothetical protein [Cryobacterium psychrophilum]|uniref:DUF4352 domain-containing protein n=1 Tax=Cryobacterium psychrophilum TaxID=41988 RepID=A0A4Y8KN14_9MICO|nr:hypothetical protein [Cryobacterium psychrophilum]TDW29960.1 hypothetical protein EDD25_1686 [Cryobacterium psychrophilum]TFD76521.1 hypothetical protein E3T53_13665 [Cryobacterium psychrophilum]
MTVQPPAPSRVRWVTRLGWIAVASAVIVLIVLTTAVVRANTAAQESLRPAASATPTPGRASPAATSGATPSASPEAPNTATPVAPDPETAPPVTAPPTVPGDAAPPVEQAPVSLTDSAAAVTEVVFSLGALKAVDGVAQGPGEVGGPAVRFTLTVRNDTAATVSLAATIVNFYAGADQAPAGQVFQPGGVPLPREVKPGQTATGTFVFVVPQSDRDQVKITVDYSVGVPLVVFQGAAPA